MPHRAWLWALAVCVAAASPRDADAQRLPSFRLGPSASPSLTQAVPAAPRIAAAPLTPAPAPGRAIGERPSPWPYVAVGAFVGVVAAAVYAKHYARTHEDCFCGASAFAPHFAAGAVAGGLAGAAVYYARGPRRERAAARVP